MKNYTITLQGKEITITQNKDGTFNKPDIVYELEKQGTATKPAHEPICMARKPLAAKTVAENCLKWKCGGLNIDVSRVEITDTKNGFRPNSANKQYTPTDSFAGGKITEQHPQGRFPANLIHDNSEEVRECFPETKNGGQNNTSKRETWLRQETEPTKFSGDSGNASRFFKSILYYPKASKSERNKGCEGLEEKEEIRTNAPRENEYVKTPTRTNNHPTVKPIALMEYLIKMVTFEGGVVLDPFAGSGTTLIAAKKNGYQYIGIEKESEYIEIINARLDDAQLNIFEL